MPTLTTCTLDCPDRCSILCRVEAGGIRLRGNPASPYTRGFTCAKIRRYPARLTSPHRIREPWVREGAGFRPAPWDEALDRVCEALDRARRRDPARILWVRGAGSMGVSKAALDYLMGALGARGTRGSLCDGAGIAAVEADAGRLDMNDPLEIDRAEAIVLWGKNPRASSVHTAAQVAAARRRGVPVIAVTPDPSGLRGLADRVVRVRPGTDRFLALACARLFLEIEPRTPPWDRAANAEAFRALAFSRSAEAWCQAADVALEDARALADLYAATPKVATVVGWGVQRHPLGAQNVRAIHALAFLAGSLGVEGGGLYFNIPSSRHLPRPRPDARAPDPLLLPALARELPAAVPPVEVVWVAGSNLLNQAPDTKGLVDAFSRIETRIVVDGFWTETARRATVVLPPALWLEEEDLVGSYWANVVGAVRKVVDPPEGCRGDFEIVAEVARRLGVGFPFADREEWLRACLPAGGPTLGDLRAAGWARMPWPAVAWDEGFAHPDGRFRFLERVDGEPAPALPLRFLTLIRAGALHSQMLPEEQTGPLEVRVHPSVAERLGLAPGDPVRVVGEVGELEGTVREDPDLHPGCAAVPRGGWAGLGLGVNEAVPVRLTDAGETGAYYGATVRLEPGTRR